MGHVFRPNYTIPVPPNAVSCVHKNRPAVRWKGRGGLLRVGILCADPGRCLVEAKHWYACYTDAAGKEKRVKGYVDRSATEAMLAKLVQTAERIRAGLLPPEAARPRFTLTELLIRWHDHLASESSPRHAACQQGRVMRIATVGGIDRPDGFTPAAVARAINQLKTDRELSSATGTAYLTAVKTFTRWLHAAERHLETDPLESVSVSTRHDPTFERRALEPGELEKLIAAARSGNILYGLSGLERAALYLTAASTGLRSGELASLTAASFDLDRFEVAVRGRDAKNKKPETLPFPRTLAKELKPLLKGLSPSDPVWPNRTGHSSANWHHRAADMLRADLAAANIVARDDRGRVVDFHALRTTYGTDLDRAGVSLSRAQKLMRHSTPALTSKFYQRPEREELAADVNRLRR